MTPRYLSLTAAAGSALLLLGAFLFQSLGYAPCAMCLWQRWPHAAAIGIGVLAFAFGAPRALTILGALAALTTGVIGIYHTGVERDWWEGPASCTGGGGQGLGDLTGDALLATSDAPKLIMCDQVSWEFLTLSMPSWNAVFSLLLAGLWIAATLRHR